MVVCICHTPKVTLLSSQNPEKKLAKNNKKKTYNIGAMKQRSKETMRRNVGRNKQGRRQRRRRKRENSTG
jgi:hypothetical protein